MSKLLESSSTLWSTLRGWRPRLGQPVHLRLALVVGVVTFFLAVGLDAAGHPAVAADLANPIALLPVRVISVDQASSPGPYTPAARVAPTQERVGSPMALAQSHHGMMTSALLTHHRLTRSQILTTLASEP